jgi:hypothetical protein
MDVLYYYYYLFYTRVLPDRHPHATVIFTLSFTESLLLNGILDILSAHLSCVKLETWMMFTIFLILMGVNFIVYSRPKRIRIMEQKPRFFSSHKSSILIASLWFLIAVSFMLWKSIYVKEVIDRCRYG